jgi:RHS repeat-associated protein
VQPARALLSPRRRWGYRRRVRQDVLRRSFVYNLRLPGQYADTETGLNYNYFRDYDPGTGRYVESDPIGLAGGSWSIFTYAGSEPIDQVDYFGLAQCTLVLAGGKGALQCTPDTPVNASVNIPVSSGNNGGGESCKNNLACQAEAGRGPIPAGCWQWTNGSTQKPNGRVLEPCKGWNGLNRTLIRSHSCANPFGPAKGPRFCSEGCVTGTVPAIQALNSTVL